MDTKMLIHSSTANDYKWVKNEPMLTLMPHGAKLKKYMIKTFFIWNYGYRTKIKLQYYKMSCHATVIVLFYSIAV